MKFNYRKIKPIRKSKGLTQGDVVNFLSTKLAKHYNRSTISSKECGRNPFNLEELEALAEYFEVEVTEFFDGDTESKSRHEPLTTPQQPPQEMIAMTVEMQTYLLSRVKDLEERLRSAEERLRFYENPQTGAATPANKKSNR